MTIRRHYQTVFLALVILVTVGSTGCTGQPPRIPPNITIGEKPYGGDATDNPVIDTRRHAVSRNARGEFTFADLGVRLVSTFDGGRLTKAGMANDGYLEAFIDSENFPINDSPWYSFRVIRLANSGPIELKIRLTYPRDTRGDGHKGTHRYRPKISRDNGQSWSPIASDAYDHKKAEFTLKLTGESLHVSAQELETSERSRKWAESLAQKEFVSIEILEKTPRDRDLRLLHIEEGTARDKSEVFLMSRQHPPEVTGTLAMRTFVEYLCGDTADARSFRRLFNVRVVPMVNPDGVDYGFWRHNSEGVDLNRDWSESTRYGREPLFNQPETRIVAAALKRYEDRNVAFAMDFHSTQHDVFYLLTDEHRDLDDDVALNWIFRFARSLPNRRFQVHKVADRVYYSTSLAWMNRRFGCPVAVYEVGDDTPRDQLVIVAVNAAQALIRELMLTRK